MSEVLVVCDQSDRCKCEGRTDCIWMHPHSPVVDGVEHRWKHEQPILCDCRTSSFCRRADSVLAKCVPSPVGGKQ
jgi:hypothetical protein